MKTIDQINFQEKKTLIRVDFNVPLNENFEITDDTRIKASIPTIKKILDNGGSVILMSHLGRPKGKKENKYSLRHLIHHISTLLGVNILFAKDCVGDETKTLADNLKKGEVLLLENLRFYSEETNGNEEFAKQLSELGDVYINDAFGTAHRAHASTSIIAQFFETKGCGYIMSAELENAKRVLENAKQPFTAIMGGAKISDKIEIIKQLLEKVDNLIIGGGMSYTFFKAKGYEIGNSLVENDKLSLAKEIIKISQEKKVNLLLPEDSIIANDFSENADIKSVDNNDIPKSWMGLDIGEKATEEFSKIITDSKTILWNGPMGVFEMKKFAKGTNEIAKAVAEATSKGAFSLIGGGDSASAINNLGYTKSVSYVSTGGGALLEYFEGKVLPGVKSLE